MEIKIYWCEYCDGIKFPNGIRIGFRDFRVCKCCRKRDLMVVKIEVEEVSA